ncbi:MAG: hypothetical protein ACRYFS_23205 [Janthinobacterium lividum]
MTRKRKLLLFCFLPISVFFAVLIVIGLVRFVEEPRREIGTTGASILKGAERVEAFRLDDGGDGDHVKEGTSGDEIADYPIKSQSKTLGPHFAAKLAQTVMDPRTFLGPSDTSCEINPGVAFRAWQGQKCVEVIICFHCQQMLITTKDAQGHETHSAYTQMTAMCAEFLALAREAFPGDKEIQSLK